MNLKTSKIYADTYLVFAKRKAALNPAAFAEKLLKRLAQKRRTDIWICAHKVALNAVKLNVPPRNGKLTWREHSKGFKEND